MGRAAQASGPASGRNDKSSKKSTQVKIKRKKRKRELEQLHRNVLEAKRAARCGAVQHRTKLKTNFAKVLSEFADKRRDNEEENQVKDGMSRKKKSKKICDRLLPQPMLGLYEKGAKGREICRGAGRLDEKSDARLRGNVLKLLKGDETSPKSLWEKEGTEKKMGSNSDRPSDDSNQSDCETVKCRCVKDPPVLDNTKGIKRGNDEGMRTTKVQEESKFGEKDQPNELQRQRDEDKCRRRLFEPDDEDEPTKNSFEIIDRPMITDHETRFSPSRPKNIVVTISYDQEKKTIPRDAQLQNCPEKSNAHKSINKTMISDHFWGWSPATCYERLCARISIDNFENKPYHRHRDPVAKIQKTLTETFLQNARQRQQNSSELSKESRESGSTAVAEKAIVASNGEDVIWQACTQDSDMDQCSSINSSATMIGSWYPPENKDDRTSVFVKNNMSKRLKNSRKSERMEEDSSTNDKNEKNDLSSIDFVQKTINSVSDFLKQFNNHNRLKRKERNMFAMEIDENKRARKTREKLDVSLDTPPRDGQLADTMKCIPRRNTMKHVPTILRRSSDRSGPVELMDHEENPCEFFAQKPEQSILKEHIFNDENSIFSSHNPFSPMERESRTSGHMTISPCAISVSREPNYYHYRTPAREGSKELTENRQLDRANGHKSKLNFVRSKYNPNPKLSWSEEPEVKLSQENGYAKGLSDRKIEGTSRDFMEVVTVRSNTRRKRTVCQNAHKIMDSAREFEKQSKGEAGEEIGEKRMAFFQGSDRFFNANDRDNVERFEDSFEGRKNVENPEIKARKTRSKFPRRAHHDNPRECMRFSSFEFPRPEIERTSYKFSEPKDIAEKKLFPRQSGEPKHPVFRDRSAAESSMGVGNENLANKPVPPSFISEEHQGRAWRHAEIETWMSQQQSQGRGSLQTWRKPQRNDQDPCPNDQSLNELSGLEQHREVPRKPVVLFRPIEEVRQKPRLHLSNVNSYHRDVPDSNVTRETVNNLREIAFEDKTGNRPVRGLDNRNYERTRKRHSPSPRNQQLTLEPSSNPLIFDSLHSYSQPPKFFAYEATEGGNPRRIPVFGKPDVPNVAAVSDTKCGAPEFTIIDEKSGNTVASYRRFVQAVRPGEEHRNHNPQQVQHQSERMILTTGQNYFPTTNNNSDSTFVPSSAAQLGRMDRQHSHRIALMVPLPSSHYQQTSKIHSSILPPDTAIDSHDITISAARASAMNDRERRCRPDQFRFDQEPSIPLPVNANRDQEQSRYKMNVDFLDGPQADNLPERIQLPDGRIGILLAQNGANSSQLLDVNLSRTSNLPCTLNRPKSRPEKRFLYKFEENDENVYSRTNFQWNVGYGANEAYHRLTRANGAPDTFTGI